MKIKNYKNNNYYKIKYCNIYNFIINIIIIDKKPKHYLRINIKKFKEKLMKKKRKYNNKKYIFIKQKNMKNKFKIKNSKFKNKNYNMMLKINKHNNIKMYLNKIYLKN